jgi:bifunctional non-homologous end joining protein LigD
MNKPSMDSLEIDHHEIALSNTDKIYFPADKKKNKKAITKGEIIDYYYHIAPTMLPYVQDRPLTVQRYPGGITGESFFQKNASDYFPAWIKRIPVKDADGNVTDYVACNDAATLVYLANQGAIVYHVWTSKAHKLTHPDRLIFDLDPAGKSGFVLVRWAAKKLKHVFDLLDLTSFVMTTGSRGVHVVVPLKPIYTNDEVVSFAREIAEYLIGRYPQKLTLTMSKHQRGDRIFLDIYRNSYAHHGVAPYSVRALPGAPVATPVTWQELLTKGVKSQDYTIYNIFRRLARKDDPWKDMTSHAHTLENARKKLHNL